MTRSFRTALLACAAIIPLAGAPAMAGSADQVKQETGEALEAMKAFTVEQKDKAVAQGREMLDSMDRQIEKLDRQITETKRDVSAETREEWREQKARLVELRADAAAKLDSLGDSTADAWKDVKDGFTDAYGALSDAVNDAVNELES